MDTSQLINGEILEAALDRVNTILKKRLSKDIRIQYEVQQLIIMFMMSDHPKTALMYSVFRPMAWVMVIGLGAIITGMATGHLVIDILVK